MQAANDSVTPSRTSIQRHIRCLSGVWNGTTLRRASVQLSKPSDATYSARPEGQPGCGRRLPQPGQLTIGEELLGYHKFTTTTTSACGTRMKSLMFSATVNQSISNSIKMSSHMAPHCCLKEAREVPVHPLADNIDIENPLADNASSAATDHKRSNIALIIQLRCHLECQRLLPQTSGDLLP